MNYLIIYNDLHDIYIFMITDIKLPGYYQENK